MTIVVTTPTGNVGSRVVQLLVRAGVLVRDPSRLPATLLPLVDVAQGDLRDAEFVAGALEGADSLFWATPEAFDVPDPLAEMVAMGSNAAAGVRSGGVGRVLQISSVGAELRQGAGLSEAAAAGIVGMTVDEFEPEQKRDFRTTTPTTLQSWAFAELRRAATGSTKD